MDKAGLEPRIDEAWSEHHLHLPGLAGSRAEHKMFLADHPMFETLFDTHFGCKTSSVPSETVF